MTDKIDISAEAVDQAVAELRDVTRCRCAPAYTDRGLHDPQCECDSAEAVEILAARLADLEAENREMALQVLASDGQAAEAYTAQQAAEAKLAKAVSTLEYIADTLALYSAKECLAELTGGKDE